MSNQFLEIIKQNYIQQITDNMTYPNYRDFNVTKYLNISELKQLFAQCSFDEQMQYAEYLAKQYDENALPLTDFSSNNHLLSNFIQFISNDETFIKQFAIAYCNGLYLYLSDEFCVDNDTYDQRYAGKPILQLKELSKIIQMITKISD